MNWIILAFGITFLEAVVSEVNRHFKLDGFALNFWRTLVAVIVVASFSMHYEWSSDPNFYYAGIIVGIVAATCMTLRLNLSSKHNGRVASLFIPLKAFLFFAVWWVFDSSSYLVLLETPWKLAAVAISFIIASISMFKMRKSDIGLYALSMATIIAVLYGLEEGLVKIVLEDSFSGFEGSFMLTTVGYSTGVILSGIIIMFSKKHRVHIFERKNIFPAIFVGLLSATVAVMFFKALALSPNPAYVSVIMMQVPVWLMIYHRAIGVKDDANPIAGLFLVISAITLIIATG